MTTNVLAGLSSLIGPEEAPSGVSFSPWELQASSEPVPSEPEPDWPSYKDPGRILVEIRPTPYFSVYGYEIQVLDHDGSTHWIAEGVGFEDWIDQHIDLELDGFYVIEGIIGSYYHGTWGVDDDDEEWDFALVRRADPEEIQTGTFRDAQPVSSTEG